MSEYFVCLILFTFNLFSGIYLSFSTVSVDWFSKVTHIIKMYFIIICVCIKKYFNLSKVIFSAILNKHKVIRERHSFDIRSRRNLDIQIYCYPQRLGLLCIRSKIKYKQSSKCAPTKPHAEITVGAVTVTRHLWYKPNHKTDTVYLFIIFPAVIAVIIPTCGFILFFISPSSGYRVRRLWDRRRYTQPSYSTDRIHTHTHLRASVSFIKSTRLCLSHVRPVLSPTRRRRRRLHTASSGVIRTS